VRNLVGNSRVLSSGESERGVGGCATAGNHERVTKNRIGALRRLCCNIRPQTRL
jgi:hypothetical protein